MSTRDIVQARLAEVVAKHSPMPFPDAIDDDDELDIFGLDSLAFMELLTAIEAALGFIPQAGCHRVTNRSMNKARRNAGRASGTLHELPVDAAGSARHVSPHAEPSREPHHFERGTRGGRRD
ncbi:MAG: acyl carrier protein [Gammaproteobacteria bacterium]|nr:acyl carrier protein [Gammaproteobacteria bacterium]